MKRSFQSWGAISSFSRRPTITWTGCIRWVGELFACAALPFLPLLTVFILTGAYLKAERDEFKRELVMRCLLWGAGASMSVNLFLGFLRIFGWSGQTPPFWSCLRFALR